MKPFRVSGSLQMGHDRHHFDIEVAETSADRAKERVVSTLGSRHRANRKEIEVEKVLEIKPDEVTDPVIARKLELGRQ